MGTLRPALLLVRYETGEVPVSLSLCLSYLCCCYEAHGDAKQESLSVYFQHLLSKLRADCTNSCDLSNPICSKVDMTHW